MSIESEISGSLTLDKDLKHFAKAQKINFY